MRVTKTTTRSRSRRLCASRRPLPSSTSTFAALLVALAAFDLLALPAAGLALDPTLPLIRRSPQLTPAANVNVNGNWAGWPTTTVIVTRTATSTGSVSSDDGDDGEEEDTTAMTTTTATATVSPTGTQTVYTTTTIFQVSEGDTAAAGQVTTTTTTTSSRRATSTTTPPAVQDDSARDTPRFASCSPGDEGYEEPGVLSATREQRTTLIAIPIMFALILIGWNFVILRVLLYPLKMLVLLIHELGHIVVGVLMDRELSRLQPDPADGGICVWKNQIEGDDSPGLYPIAALPFGYIFSILIGCTLIFCGFNTLASKVASWFIGLGLLAVARLCLRIPLGLALTAITLGLMIAFWFIEHAWYLRFYILFVGIMSCWYVLWDFIDDWVFSKINPCCCVLHADRFHMLHGFMWFWIYFAVTSLVFATTLIVAVYVFRQSPHSMFCQGQQFLPT